jgi:hypothetical protein
LLSLGSVLEIRYKRSPNIAPLFPMVIFMHSFWPQKCIGLLFRRFFTNSSGHPGGHPPLQGAVRWGEKNLTFFDILAFRNFYFDLLQAVMEAVDPRGVGVVVEASHMCMVMRGVQKINSKTVTRCRSYQTQFSKFHTYL